MAIPIINYVNITSGVGGASLVPTRNFGAMIVTTNILVPTGKIISFTSAADVGSYFGTNSDEYLRAVFYFGWVSKQITSPALLSFWNWNNDVATPSYLFGGTPIDTLAQFDAISAGQLTLTLGGFTHTLTGINLSAAGSLSVVASDIQTAIQAYSAGGAAWTGATVVYSSTTGTFNLTSGASGADTIAITAAPSNDVAGPLGWLATNAVLSNGTAAQLLPANLNQLVNISNNFGSICLGPSAINTVANVETMATWNSTTSPNVMFLHSWSTSAANASTLSTALVNIGGNTGTLQSPTTGDYPEMIPMMVFAATNYSKTNSAQNFMYQTNFNSTTTVTNQTDYNIYTAERINFYGSTQTAGQQINFYQLGLMMGPANLPQFQNVYVNEIWLKDALTASLLNLQLALPQIPASNSGRSLMLCAMQPVIDQALANGTIEAGKILNNTQRLYITNITGNNTAWQQVQNAGYWVNVAINSSVVNGVTVYTAAYTLIYSKNDVILKIIGSDILI